MRRRTQIVLAITFMVAALVACFSYIYVSQLLGRQITTAHETALYLTSQLAFLANNAAPDLTSTKVNTNDPVAVRRALTYYLSTDSDLNALLESVVGNWPTVYDAAIVDADGKAILHTNQEMNGKPVADRPDLQLLENAHFRRQLRMVYQHPAGSFDHFHSKRTHAAPPPRDGSFSDCDSALFGSGCGPVAHRFGAIGAY
jgi:hypothetical protein